MGLVMPASNTSTSRTAANTLEIASTYKAKASDSRLGLPLNANLLAATKARAITAERAALKLAFDHKYIRIDAMLYKVVHARDQERLIEVSCFVDSGCQG
jgi:hypothetical protein